LVDRAAAALAAQIRAGDPTELVEIVDAQQRAAEAALATASFDAGGGHADTIARGTASHAATMEMPIAGGLSMLFSGPRWDTRRR
jgi:xanthine/CO dehydrogenase XdhC/CoxF family maturation factor